MAQKNQRQAFSLINFTCHGERKRKIEYSSATSQAVWQTTQGGMALVNPLSYRPLPYGVLTLKPNYPIHGATKLIQLPQTLVSRN